MWRSFASACPHRSSLFLSFSNYSSRTRPYYSRWRAIESRNERVSVWWDIEHCRLPTAGDVIKVAPAIMAALRTNGIKGPIQIKAYGDGCKLADECGMNPFEAGVIQCQSTKLRNSAVSSHVDPLLRDLWDWAGFYTPPAHIFLISNDGIFAEHLHRLRKKKFNILLASTNAPDELSSAANITWQWTSLLNRENLIGTHF